MTDPDQHKPTRSPRRLRGVLFRLGAILLAATPFVLAEATFAVLDWGRPASLGDPFVGFRSIRPLFVLNEEQNRFEITKSRYAFFRPESFAKEKGANEFRIFCLGGSTVQGRPFAIETSFTTWLELSLQAADPRRKWEVVNCGGISYASYRLVPILEEVLNYQPDMVILYTGHNEFLEDRTYQHVKHMPDVVAGPAGLLLRTRTYSLLRAAYVRLFGEEGQTPDRPVLKTEVDAMLDYREGIEDYHRDEKWRRDTSAHFRYNLGRMIQMAADAGVPLWLVNPVCNLRDSAPFKTQHREGLSAEDLNRWEDLIHRASEYHAKNTYQSMLLLERALAIDDQHAGLLYLLAKCYDSLGEFDKARWAYIQAKELDICPLRILEAMNDAIVELADRTDTPLVDVRELFEALSDEGIPDGRYLIDHVHPSIEGHQLIATLICDKMIDHGILVPVKAWKESRKQRFKKHLDSLDSLYFLRGTERLERLRCWTQGKADGIRPDRGGTPSSGS